MTTVYIYALKHPETNEIRYVGLTRFPVKRLHNEINYPHTKHLENWMKSLKSAGLLPKMEILEETVEGDSCERERSWIAKMKADGCRLINYTSGGESGWTLPQDARDKARARMLGKKMGPMSQAHKEKISAANKGRLFNPNIGKIMTELNLSRRGTPLKEETKRKLSEIGKKRLIGEWKERFVQGNKDRSRKSIFSEQQRSEIKFLVADGYALNVIAEFYGCSLGTIGDVKSGRIWNKIPIASSVESPPPFKRIPMFRNEKGQYQKIEQARAA